MQALAHESTDAAKHSQRNSHLYSHYSHLRDYRTLTLFRHTQSLLCCLVMGAPPELDLRSVYAKLEWATTHFKIVDAEINAWLYSGDNKILAQRNEDGTQHYLRAYMPKPKPDFQRWSLIIGDCLTNLRDTLDHAIFAIAQLASSPNQSKRDKAAFVLAADEAQFTAWSKTKLASLPDPIRGVVASFQPFNRPHPVLPSLLYLLSQLANGNKHRLLNVAITSPGIAEVEFVSAAALLQPGRVGIANGDIEDGTVFFVFEVEIPDPSIYLRSANVGLHVAIKHPARIGDTSFGSDRTSYKYLIQAFMNEVAAALDQLVAAL